MRLIRSTENHYASLEAISRPSSSPGRGHPPALHPAQEQPTQPSMYDSTENAAPVGSPWTRTPLPPPFSPEDQTIRPVAAWSPEPLRSASAHQRRSDSSLPGQCRCHPAGYRQSQPSPQRLPPAPSSDLHPTGGSIPPGGAE